MKELYALFACDEWKSRDSMRLVGVFNRSGLNKAVLERLNRGEFELYDTAVPMSLREVKSYIHVKDLDTELTYASIQQLAVNEELF